MAVLAECCASMFATGCLYSVDDRYAIDPFAPLEANQSVGHLWGILQATPSTGEMLGLLSYMRFLFQNFQHPHVQALVRWGTLRLEKERQQGIKQHKKGRVSSLCCFTPRHSLLLLVLACGADLVYAGSGGVGVRQRRAEPACGWLGQ